ncbi:glycoside hydrolase [Plectosphaerella plurivora]|uniref:alpha-glucosidase n=1 Tax=Plectosphaerella plurivora TaxID=936078 RepID=A0A9P8VHI1_9PEZI|nr:glycoside hydrolase [Plectosphaerella plurivora]
MASPQVLQKQDDQDQTRCSSSLRTLTMDRYTFPCKPVASPDAVVAGPNYRFTVISDIILRYEWAADGVFEDRASTFALNREAAVPSFSVTDLDHQLVVRTPSLTLTYNKERFSPHGLHVSFTSKTNLWGAEWRYGGDQDPDNLGGTARTLDGVDGRCDMGTGVLSRSGFADIDDSASMLFDGNGFVAPRRPGDRIDGYLFAYGRDYRAAMRAFYALSGPQPRLPRWALGNWWSRYYAYSADEYLTLVDRFAEDKLPLSVAVIDMDWHLVQEDHVPHTGWTGYTWNTNLFPDPEAFGRALHDRRLKITLNDHPHAGVHHHEDAYEAMAGAIGHDIEARAPIPFDPTSPTFMAAYLDILHRQLEKHTCDFWWIDWQQGAHSGIPGFDPLWLLNHFHFLDNAITLKEQGATSSDESANNALIFSRYAGPGSQRYPVGFSGDSVSSWASLRFQPEFTATASNVGYGWWSHDIGGHYGGSRDDELATRWLQFGVFSPINRLHSSNSPWTSKEPWRYRPEHRAVMSDSMRLRHRLVPYLFAASIEGAATGEPLVQPLYWEYPSRDEAYEKPNEYLFGPAMVVAPIVQPRDPRTNLAPVDVWVPPARHVDIFTGVVYDGDREMKMYRHLESIPVLAAEGSLIPLDYAPSPSNGCTNPEGYEVLVVVGKDAKCTIYEDPTDDADASGSGETREIKVSYDQATGKLTTSPYKGSWRFKVISFGGDSTDVSVSVDGKSVEASVTADTRVGASPGIVIDLPKAGGAVTVSLGSTPKLKVGDWTPQVEALILDLQIEFHIKDKLWDIWRAKQPVAVKVGRILTLGLEEAISGPILEFLLADSRQA